MADTPAADIHIAVLTVRGPGLSAASGRALAGAVAGAVAGQGGERASIAGLTVRLPASVLTAEGGIDTGAIREAFGRRWRARDA